MSYEHLAGRIVEIQRSMVGRPAITIAQSTDGLVVTDDGNVESIEGDPRTVLDELVEGYTEMLGDPAASRFRMAATEFRGELELPASLGGTPESDTAESAGPDVRDAAADDAGPSASRGSSGAGATGTAASPPQSETGDPTPDGSTLVTYTVQQAGAGGYDPDEDLESVYLLTEDEHDWKAPVTVAEAITSAVATATGLDRDELGDIEEYVESDRVLSTLHAEHEPPVSFRIGDHAVTVYPDGNVRVQRSV